VFAQTTPNTGQIWTGIPIMVTAPRVGEGGRCRVPGWRNNLRDGSVGQRVINNSVEKWAFFGKNYAFKGKEANFTGLDNPSGFLEVESPRISRRSTNKSSKVVSLMHRPPLPRGNIPRTYFYWRLSRPQGHSAAGRIIFIPVTPPGIENATFRLCSSVPQPTASPRTP
jgi:hypothetical protein